MGAVIDHHVWFYVVPGVLALDAVGPHDVLAAANRVADHRKRGGVRYRTRLVGARAGALRTETGLQLLVDQTPDEAEPLDTLFVPGGSGVRAATEDPDVIAAIAELGRRAERVATVCTGAFLPAAAGLLDGRRATTHWAWGDALAERHPAVDVDTRALHVHDGPVWTSAGVTAGIDLALAIVEHDHDPEIAQHTARWLVVHLRRPGGQSPFASPVWADPSPIEPIRRARQLIEGDPAGDHRVEVLAGRVGLSARHFSRLFTAETGRSPARFVEVVRVEAARRRLEAGRADGLEPLARQCGFGSAETLRRAFHRHVGLSPAHYRQRFTAADQT